MDDLVMACAESLSWLAGLGFVVFSGTAAAILTIWKGRTR